MTEITKKQYLFSSRKFLLPGMQEILLGEKYLYIDRNLNIVQCKTSDKKEVYILGNAFCTDKKDKCPEKDVSLYEEKDLSEATRFWTGRWVIITSNMLLTDACSLMSAFYTENEGNFYISSSIALISNVLNKPIETSFSNIGLTWQLLPRTIIPDVRALICTQKMSFEEGRIRISPRMWMQDRTALPTEEKSKVLSEMLVNAFYNINKFSGKKIVVALTGGKDSRVTFSALIKSGVPFSAYTAWHDNISSSDKNVPPKLCALFGIGHNYVKKKKISKERFQDYINFCGMNSKGIDALFFARGQFDDFGNDVVIIRSGLYEAGQNYSRKIAGGEMENFEKSIKSYYMNEFSKNGLQKIAFDEYISYVEENPISFVDLRDRFYIEQRVCGWVSAIEQSLDINDFTSIQIANCSELLSILVSCNEEERNRLALSYDTIRILEPKVLNLDVNRVGFTDKMIYIKNIIKNPKIKFLNFINKYRGK